jgi:hypothetical protein
MQLTVRFHYNLQTRMPDVQTLEDLRQKQGHEAGPGKAQRDPSADRARPGEQNWLGRRDFFMTHPKNYHRKSRQKRPARQSQCQSIPR